MMDLTSSPCPPCPRAHINFINAQSLLISPAGNDVRDGENVAIDVIRTQAFTAIDLRLLPYGNVSKSAT